MGLLYNVKVILKGHFKIQTGQHCTKVTVKHAVDQQIKTKLTKIQNKYNKVNTFQVDADLEVKRFTSVVSHF